MCTKARQATCPTGCSTGIRAMWKIVTLSLCYGCSAAAFSDNNIDCNNPRGTLEVNQCVDLEAKESDKRLNEVFRRVIKKLTHSEHDADQDAERGNGDAWKKGTLIDAQRAWIKYRDAQCKAVYYQWAPGTGSTSAQLACLKELTDARINDLEAY